MLAFKETCVCVYTLLTILSTFQVNGNVSRGRNYELDNDVPVSTDILEKLITPPQAASLLGLSPSSLSAAHTVNHPLDPLTALEIRAAALIIRDNNRTASLQFKCIGLREPEKSLLLPYYLSGTVPPPGTIPRKADVLVADAKTQAPAWVVVNLDTYKVESWTEARADEHAATITIEDQTTVINVAFADPRVVQRINGLGFYDLSSVVVDVWESGYVADNPNYASTRHLLQLFFYVVLGDGDLYYAHPFDFVVYVDLVAKVVRGIENLPIQQGFDRANRTGNSVPRTITNLLPTSIPQNQIKPIAISRPEGVSFTVQGRLISWQNFQFRVGYNPREGAVINQVTYSDNGKLRSLFYRLSITEVFIYFGDPRPPYQRKSSHDMGNYEFGTNLQSLSPEFCRGQAYYFDSVISNEQAETTTVKNTTCVFEEDAGLLWAHYDYRSGTQAVTRSQRLSVSSYISLGNVGYVFSWRFYQDATIELSVKLTGLLNTNLMAVDVKAPPYGNLLKPQLYTQNFQVFFGARIDADVDGVQNTVFMEDIVSVPGQNNPYGNGIQQQVKVFRKVGDAPSDIVAGRTWRISNSNKGVNPASGRQPSWKLVPQGPNMPNLLRLDSPLRKKVSWANHNMWVLPYNENQLFIDDLYQDGGVSNWTRESFGTNIANEDLVLWHVFGLMGTPDPEVWPVVSRVPDTVGFRLRPSNFFTQNPAVNVPPASQTTAYDDQHEWHSIFSPQHQTGWKTESRIDNEEEGR